MLLHFIYNLGHTYNNLNYIHVLRTFRAITLWQCQTKLRQESLHDSVSPVGRNSFDGIL